MGQGRTLPRVRELKLVSKEPKRVELSRTLPRVRELKPHQPRHHPLRGHRRTLPRVRELKHTNG